MAWDAKATPRFLRSRKKLSPAVRKALNKAQAQVIQDPYRGDRKRPPLGWLWVEKFKAENDQWLLGYEIDDKRDLVIFHAIGQHENFYRDIQRRGGGEVEKRLEEE